MDNREILERFKNGDLERGQAAALLTGAAPDGTQPPPGVRSSPDGRPPFDVQPSFDAQPLSGVAEGSAPPLALRPADPGPCEERPVDEGCAIVGIGGRYPGAPGLDDLWRTMLAAHRDDPRPAVGRGGDSSQPGHALDGIDGFDPLFFGITDEEGASMDPQERLFLETAWQTLENAGYLGGRLDTLVPAAGGEPRSLGVFAAVSSHDYALQSGVVRGGHWSLPDRLTRLLDLSGPSQAVDTADSSFLVALHHARAALRAGECAAALVGAVELRLHPSRQGADHGEGVGMVLLRPLAQARADGDTVHAVVRSSALGGLPDAAVPDADMVHETKETVIPAVGDAGAALGAAALTRAVLQLREGTRAPVAEGDSAVPWTGERPRRASVAVRGAGGRSARVLLEEYLPNAPDDLPRAAHPTDREELILLSAPSPAHLSAAAARLAAVLDEQGPSLPAVAHALRAGRAPMSCRLAVVARTTGELARALDAFAQGRDTTPAELCVADLTARGGEALLPARAPETRDYLAALWRANRTHQLTRLWLAGVDVCVAQGGGPSVELPGAAFLRRSLWIGSGR